jgi:DNA polymerase-1
MLVCFPAVRGAIADLPDMGASAKAIPIRPSVALLASADHIVTTAEQADRLVGQLSRLSIGAIAIDTEFQFASDPVNIRRGREWRDISTLVPLILSGAAWVPEQSAMIRFAIDLRVPELIPAVNRLLGLHVTFVAHNIKAEFQTFWALGLDPILTQTYDTFIAARALLLGRSSPEMSRLMQARLAEDLSDVDEASAAVETLLSLAGQARIYGRPHQFAATKDQLQRGFLNHPTDAPFTDLQLRYAMADAEATLAVYRAQQSDVTEHGLHHQLHVVEFPFAQANARMEWDGLAVSVERLCLLLKGLGSATRHHEQILTEAGLANPRSPIQVANFLTQRGHGAMLARSGKVSTEDSTLELIEPWDSMVMHIRRHRRYSRLVSDKMFTGELIGSDGRLHPTQRHLGADTGRNTCSSPNIVGISKTFRPIVVAPRGRALIEFDFSQIEVGVAAAEHGDTDLIAAFNSGDVYAAVAQQFYHGELTEDQRSLSVYEFKQAQPDLRNKVKIFVLACLYNIRDKGIADRFGITVTEARVQREAFLDKFPGIKAAMESAKLDGRVRGFSPIIGGLRRHIPPTGRADNQHINTPVQAGAGVVFRKAVVDLYRSFRGTDTKLVLPVHDSVLIECDLDQVDALAQRVPQIMAEAVRTYYPQLQPRVDANLKDTSCWNKDGHSDSIDSFLSDPTFKL